jgi:outer membrane lipoprotein-sorting protein
MSDFPEHEVIRRLELLGSVQPSPEVTRLALERVRQSLKETPVVQAPIFRIPFPKKLRFSRLAAAAAVLIAVGIGALLFFPSGVAGPGGFARVQAAMRATETVKCRQTISFDGNTMEVSQLLIRREGLFRDERSNGYTVVNANKDVAMVVNPMTREATRLHGTRVPPANLVEAVRNVSTNSATQALPAQAIDDKPVIGFEVTAQAKKVKLWADPESLLPVRIESDTVDDHGALLVCTLDEFVFGQELDDALFTVEAPEGYTVKDKGIAIANLVLTPGEGMGPIKFGMSRKEVVELLGTPDAEQEVKDVGLAMSYATHGFAITVNKDKGVSTISCFAQPAGSEKVIGEFTGKTDKGIALGASSTTIVRAYGEPDQKQAIKGLTQLRYDGQRVEFMVSSNDKLVLIWLFRP